MPEGDENPFMQPRGGAGGAGGHGGGGGMPGLGGLEDMDGMDDDPGLMLAIQAGIGQAGGADRLRRDQSIMLTTSSNTQCTGDRHIIHHIAYWCSPCYLPPSVPVLATSSTT